VEISYPARIAIDIFAEFALDTEKVGKFMVAMPVHSKGMAKAGCYPLARDGSECVVGANDPSVWQRRGPMNSRRL